MSDNGHMKEPTEEEIAARVDEALARLESAGYIEIEPGDNAEERRTRVTNEGREAWFMLSRMLPLYELADITAMKAREAHVAQFSSRVQ